MHWKRPGINSSPIVPSRPVSVEEWNTPILCMCVCVWYSNVYEIIVNWPAERTKHSNRFRRQSGWLCLFGVSEQEPMQSKEKSNLFIRSHNVAWHIHRMHTNFRCICMARQNMATNMITLNEFACMCNLFVGLHSLLDIHCVIYKYVH